MTNVDGSFGEGGGQILRSSLALSLVTGKPFCIERIRAGRKNPGLQRQHLAAVHAAAAVSGAQVEGAELGSQRLTFVPHEVRPGEYHFAISSAGSTTLVVQTVLPALALSAGASKLRLEGGTHNMHAPPVDFLQKSFLPLLGRMGMRGQVQLERCGFYPAGGGRLTLEIQPPGELRRLELLQRGPICRRAVRGLVSRLPSHIAQREVRTVLDELEWPGECGAVEEVASPGPGNVVLIEISCQEVTEVFTGFGQRGVPAETVARTAAQKARRYLERGVPVGEHLADQLLLPMALGRGGAFRTMAPSKHTETNLHTLRQFLDVCAAVEKVGEDIWEIRIEPAQPPKGLIDGRW